MGTRIRPEVSIKNDFHIGKERYYELLHFCRQYREWERNKQILYSKTLQANQFKEVKTENQESHVEKMAIEIKHYSDKIDLVNYCCAAIGEDMSNYIFKAVVDDVSYNKLRADGMPASKNLFYDRYRKFFWLLDKGRG